jgi:hypothetical protein
VMNSAQTAGLGEPMRGATPQKKGAEWGVPFSPRVGADGGGPSGKKNWRHRLTTHLAPVSPAFGALPKPICYERTFESVRNGTPRNSPFTFKAQGGGESATLKPPGQKPHRKMVPWIETFRPISGNPYAGTQPAVFGPGLIC